MDEMENKPDDAGESHEPRPLDYYYSASDGDAARPRQYGCGLVVALLGVGVVGFFGFLDAIGNNPAYPVIPKPVLVFLLLATAAGAGAIRISRSTKRWGWRSFWLGMLTGLAIAGLLEGVCFAIYTK